MSSWDIRILKLPIQWNWSILLSFHLNTMYLNWKMAGGTLLHLTQTDGAFQTKTQCPKRTTERWYLYLVKKNIFLHPWLLKDLIQSCKLLAAICMNRFEKWKSLDMSQEDQGFLLVLKLWRVTNGWLNQQTWNNRG